MLTGDRRGAGTDANVYLAIYGANGDCGKRQLSGKGNCFERNKTDSFELELLDLGDLTKVRVSHDNSLAGSVRLSVRCSPFANTIHLQGWFLNKIIITNKTTSAKWYFLCGRWLDTDEDDGQLERELPAATADGRRSAVVCFVFS